MIRFSGLFREVKTSRFIESSIQQILAEILQSKDVAKIIWNGKKVN